MTWASALRAVPTAMYRAFARPDIPQHTPDWSRLVSLDFETFFDDDYTLKKLSTSEYIRDPRFKAQMLGIKVGTGKTRIIPPNRIKSELAKINWSTHSALCHHTQFDGLILSHHYGVHPRHLYCTLSMARGLHSNDIGAGLDEVAQYYGGHGKIDGLLELTRGVRTWNKILFNQTAPYCANDVDEMYRIFKCMLPRMPADEIDTIDWVIRCFTSPVLRVNLPRVEAELKRELERRDVLFASILNPVPYYDDKEVLKSKLERALTGKERDTLIVRRIIGSNEKFADLLRAEGVDPPLKLSPAWMKGTKEERADESNKWAYAFAKDDIKFVELPNQTDDWGFDLNVPADVAAMAAKQTRLQALIDTRIAVKSTTNITRAERFLSAGANGMALPAYYAYSRAHTHRLGGGDKRNLQNLTRGGELRESIEAPPGHEIVVVDSGQIEARVNAWLWGQDDLLDAFRTADKWDKSKGVARGDDRDAYCKFGDAIYGREITTLDKTERFVSKVGVLGLGFQMGPKKLQLTLAKGALGGPPVYFTLNETTRIVGTYRIKNYRIAEGWNICKGIIEDMATGRSGRHGPISWEKETVWLPNGMFLRYPDLKKAKNAESGWDEWTYQAKDIRKKIYGGLLCLGANTEVLTDDGWKPIVEVRLGDKLWDGTNWITHSGLVARGVKETIDFGGVDMTPDHEVLVNYEWVAAKDTTHHEATSSFSESYRHPFRHAASDSSDRQRRTPNFVDGAMRLWQYTNFYGVGIRQRIIEKLRLCHCPTDFRIPNNSWHVSPSGIRSVAQHDLQMHIAYAPILEALRRAWDYGVRAVGQVQKFLGRHGGDLQTWAGFRPKKQHAGLHNGQLPLGDTSSECTQHQGASADQHTPRPNAPLASSGNFEAQQHDAAVPQARQVASSRHVQQTRLPFQEVYDLVDAGPLKRFTVRGTDGQPFIVHNCENVVQSLARIIVIWQTLQISRKHRVVMSTHDEAAAIAKAREAEKCFTFMTKWMRTPPAWCPDIPLNCEGGHALNYSK